MRWAGGSASPAFRHGFAPPSGLSPTAALKRLAETLELPGIVTDYHFAIQGTVGALWSQRRDNPEVLEDIERLSWLDIRLLQASPDDFLVGRPGQEDDYYSITAFGTLRLMYEREGLLRQALEVERLAAQFGQARTLDDLEAKVAVLDDEVRS